MGVSALPARKRRKLFTGPSTIPMSSGLESDRTKLTLGMSGGPGQMMTVAGALSGTAILKQPDCSPSNHTARLMTTRRRRYFVEIIL